MNDCLWGFISGVCDCENCSKCNEYLSANSKEGGELLEKYKKDVDEALKPVCEKWKKDKESGKYGRNR
ncbi:MAG: hypothetical protein NC548_65275 [Lachnospiraceae bacterium]|nr:hypothetical protein [Lachnospiraceae bacterium]